MTSNDSVGSWWESIVEKLENLLYIIIWKSEEKTEEEIPEPPAEKFEDSVYPLSLQLAPIIMMMVLFIAASIVSYVYFRSFRRKQRQNEVSLTPEHPKQAESKKMQTMTDETEPASTEKFNVDVDQTSASNIRVQSNSCGREIDATVKRLGMPSESHKRPDETAERPKPHIEGLKLAVESPKKLVPSESPKEPALNLTEPGWSPNNPTNTKESHDSPKKQVQSLKVDAQTSPLLGGNFMKGKPIYRRKNLNAVSRLQRDRSRNSKSFASSRYRQPSTNTPINTTVDALMKQVMKWLQDRFYVESNQVLNEHWHEVKHQPPHHQSEKKVKEVNQNTQPASTFTKNLPPVGRLDETSVRKRRAAVVKPPPLSYQTTGRSQNTSENKFNLFLRSEFEPTSTDLSTSNDQFSAVATPRNNPKREGFKTATGFRTPQKNDSPSSAGTKTGECSGIYDNDKDNTFSTPVHRGLPWVLDSTADSATDATYSCSSQQQVGVKDRNHEPAAETFGPGIRHILMKLRQTGLDDDQGSTQHDHMSTLRKSSDVTGIIATFQKEKLD